MAKRTGLLALLIVGAGAGYWVWASTSSRTVWTEPVTKALTISEDNLTGLRIKTYNGSITFSGSTDAPPSVVATIKGGGETLEIATAALSAIEPFARVTEPGKIRVGWQWKGRQKQEEARGMVSFQVVAPPTVGLFAQTRNGFIRLTKVAGGVEAETHNGRITGSGLSGRVLATTHNGTIDIESTGEKLKCRTHNGGIDVRFSGATIDLKVHNGSVSADLSQGGPVGGEIASHNGSIEVVVGDKTAAELDFETDRGTIRCTAALTNRMAKKRKLHGDLGGGGPLLEADTHNGGISLLLED